MAIKIDTKKLVISILFIIIVLMGLFFMQNKEEEQQIGEFNTNLKVKHTFPGQHAYSHVWWQTKPSSVYYNNKTYFGFQTIDYQTGDILIQVRDYNHENNKFSDIVTLDRFSDLRDDHASPSLLIIPEGKDKGKVMIFWSSHHGKTPINYVISKNKEEIKTFSEVKTLPLPPGATNGNYPVPIYLDNGDIIVFYRTMRANNTAFALSKDKGKSWKTKVLFDGTINKESAIHYVDYRKGVLGVAISIFDRIKSDYVATYYMQSLNGGLTWTKADGTTIAGDLEEPITSDTAELVNQNDNGVWTWDIRIGEDGPIIVSTDNIRSTYMDLRYDYWDEKKWTSSIVTKSARGLQREPSGRRLYDVGAYAGGIVLDPENPESTVYISKDRDGIFEIEAWNSKDQQKWNLYKKITESSIQNNFRPQVVENIYKGIADKKPTLVWNSGYYYSLHERHLPDGRTDAPWNTVLMDNGNLTDDIFLKMPEGLLFIDTISGYYNGMRFTGGSRNSIPLAADSKRNIIPITTHSNTMKTTLKYSENASIKNFDKLPFIAGHSELPIWGHNTAGNMQLYVRMFGRVDNFEGKLTDAYITLSMSNAENEIIIFEKGIDKIGKQGSFVTEWRVVPNTNNTVMSLKGKTNNPAGKAIFLPGTLGIQFGIGPYTVPIKSKSIHN